MPSKISFIRMTFSRMIFSRMTFTRIVPLFSLSVSPQIVPTY
jgi:hypothetical protein